jgi:hypothetical protein
MDKLEGMWVALTAYQPQADAAGHGESWAAMCSSKTAADAADAAMAAMAADAAKAADAATNAVYAAYYAAIFATNAANAEKWARHVIEDINRVLEEKT